MIVETPAQRAGCCLAGSKDDCRRPPCPCNLDAWTPQERHDLDVARRKAIRAAIPSEIESGS